MILIIGYTVLISLLIYQIIFTVNLNKTRKKRKINVEEIIKKYFD